ncbi:hypothetical protein MLD38_035881 [Melastoma candidum]|uniref:Uncharacterized protein n=1 Tax=Melastoma candidum TaxID=119954 RepID=A0ACB9LJS4_9MYRT|nr:hypothetical protein MLD38_035881 [Melastoma candidum]
MDGKLHELLAVLESLRCTGVLGELLQRLGLVSGVPDVADGGIEPDLDELRRVGGVASRLLEGADARLLVMGGLADALDGLHRSGHGDVLGGLSVTSVVGLALGNPDDQRDSYDHQYEGGNRGHRDLLLLVIVAHDHLPGLRNNSLSKLFIYFPKKTPKTRSN